MAVQQPDVSIEDLTDADRKIIDVLHEGARTKGAIEDEAGLHRNTVGNRLDVLVAGDVVKRIHDRTALYELVDDPRADSDAGGGDVTALREERDQLQADLDDCQEELAQARAERDALEQRRAGVDLGPVRRGLEAAASALDTAGRQDPDVATAQAEIDRALEAIDEHGD